MWQAIGGFDQHLRAHEEVDFWSRAIEAGRRGVVIPEPLLNYRVRAAPALSTRLAQVHMSR